MPSVPNLPDLSTIRTVKVDDPVLLPTDKRAAFSVADYQEIVINVILENAATAVTLDAFYWSPAAGRFFVPDPTLTYTGGERQLRWRVNRAARIYIRVTGIVGGVPADDRVLLEIGGVPANHEVG